MKGFISLNLIPADKLRRRDPALSWVIILAALLLGQGAAMGSYWQYNVVVRLADSQNQLYQEQKDVAALQTSAAKLQAYQSDIQQTRTLQQELGTVQRGTVDWVTLAGLLESVAGGTTQIGQVTLTNAGLLQLNGTSASLSVLDSFVKNLPSANFQNVFVGNVQDASGTQVQFALRANYVPTKGGVGQ